MYKVHWIIDGIANVNEKNQEDAEKVINSKIQKFLSENSDFFDKIVSNAPENIDNSFTVPKVIE